MARLPDWARWQAENPPPGWTGRPERVNRFFWRSMAWEVRFWLSLTALAVIACVAFLVWALVSRL